MVFRIEKNKNYTIMSNHHLRNKNLSFKAKGLLSFMLSLPDDWDYSLNGLVNISKESKKAIRNILAELKENGYLIIEQDRDEKGYYKYNYIIYEEPFQIEKEKVSPDTQKGNTDYRDAENNTQINTKRQFTNSQIDKGDKTNSPFFDGENHNHLTIDLLKRNYISEDDTQIYYYDKLFEELLVEYSYQDLLKINHYIVTRVISRNFCDEDGYKIENKFGYLKSSIINNLYKLKYLELEIDEETNWFKDLDEDLELYK